MAKPKQDPDPLYQPFYSDDHSAIEVWVEAAEMSQIWADAARIMAARRRKRHRRWLVISVLVVLTLVVYGLLQAL